jgi:hypothetical protein
MEIKQLNTVFDNLSQRVACSYCRSLAEFIPVMPAGLSEQEQREMEASQRDLHAFFKNLYEVIYQDPAVFGLPVTGGDIYIKNDGSETQQQKQEVNRKLQKPRDRINEGLDFLILAGLKGRLAEDGGSLLLDNAEYAGYLQKSRTSKQFLKGLPAAGLAINEAGEKMLLSSEFYPALWPALQAMAAAYAQAADGAEQKEKDLARFNFARCDFRSLVKGYRPIALDLYRIFNPEDCARVSELHAYFTKLDYKPVYQIYGINGWEVQYQGKKQIKASPLLRIEYQERFRQPLRVGIKCASTERIVKLLAKQPHFLQEDFNRRANKCNGDACGWCKNRKNLGPSTLVFDGQERTICWYSNPDFKEINDDSVSVIKQYALMHEELA